MRTTSDLAIEKIKQWEGLRLRSYQDSAGVWTIGYGHTSDSAFRVGHGLSITEAKATELLRHDLGEAEQAVDGAVKVPLNDSQFGALVSFAFNVGNAAFLKSTLLRKLNAGAYEAVPSELAKWNKAGGKVVQGLVNRRAAEAGLWSTGAFVSSASAPVSAGSTIKQAITRPEVLAAATTVGGGLATAASGNGPLSWAISIVIVGAAALAAFLIIRKEMRA
ncbi:lysozyme [Pleomorphomonas sp. JP5]|uniref:lysozyme n=1 Tax=Pleomorphomonas sp. JP5 TaxID=2942998 RepID=UPI0020434106|nr:lysozyme [Pleomorphomonas sp. JP5]MCM5558475.1 lysozyme [Pleomorphomonas sp. JP5]